MATSRNFISCGDIPHRKGLIEVAVGIHPGHLNLEIWHVHPELNLEELNLSQGLDLEGRVVGNTELELSADEVRQLIEHLTRLLRDMEKHGDSV